ncbi:protein SHORT HYPOCOTYL IN WHITE LIGHT 1 [Gastrolobium bilobum]|uniref:protein SHORT HYPOCOTYL IN WHITE LIGHT 1 n=1 Tax=Gastrolobium bilobum TaxID=150636 RepID=UPI002AB08948|nr:protein SHORT HYPOCOTYL IN WHITE LIGHT 1 [Gastrolobium bilobum]
MPFSVTVKSAPLAFFRSSLNLDSVSFRACRIALPPRHASSQRVSNFSQPQPQPQGGGSNFIHDPRAWSDDDDENDEDRSFDLLVRFVQNVFKKVSKRARKAIRSVLPVPISTKLVGFSVNGVLVLACLWILKAFLEVVCTLGSVVFVSILLIRGIWSGVSFLQESRNQKMDEFDVEHNAWNGAQPVT